MLKKATEENIVVGLTNVYDHFFVAAEKGDSKVTASRLPYFDGDCWSGNAMEAAKTIEKECVGDYEKMLKEQVPNRALKTMGHANPSKDTAKDILVMRKVCLPCLTFIHVFSICSVVHLDKLYNVIRWDISFYN
jgi:E1A/CREB-binding protein